ncbi:amidohydrolase family protein, partial [Candidatus Peregrinibacteria bacterium]|nr:amidohydrolase family protein [Candidatus Peregrinibacteria bacterium]
VHSLIKSQKCYYEAVKHVLHLAKKYDSRVHIAHVSSKLEIDEIKKFKNEKITCEVTPHHLFLNESAYDKWGNFVKIDPPLRNREDQDALWQAIDEGAIDIIASDHAPHLKEEKSMSYKQAPVGVPGVETMLPLMLEAVNDNRIDIVKVARLMSENPARIFGIKNKGKIAEGFDADLVIVDMDERRKVRNDKLFTKCGWSAFNGWELSGWPKITIVNGKKVFENGKIIAGDFRGHEVEFD